jgi:uncharacterized coiled-coil protein SlyX
VYIKDPPTTLPAALERIKELEQKVAELKTALEMGTIPAWVIAEGWEEIRQQQAENKAYWEKQKETAQP